MTDDLRRTFVKAMRQLTPLQRRWFAALPKHRFKGFEAAKALGISMRTVHRWNELQTVRNAFLAFYELIAKDWEFVLDCVRKNEGGTQ